MKSIDGCSCANWYVSQYKLPLFKLWQLTVKDKIKKTDLKPKTTTLCFDSKGAFIPRRQQVAVCSKKEHVTLWFLTFDQKKREGGKVKSGNWEDLRSREIFQNEKKNKIKNNSRVWPFSAPPFWENRRQTTVKLTECKSAAAQIDLRYCRWQRSRLVDYKEWLCQEGGKTNKTNTH